MSRPRRFGKSMTAEMLVAYYDRSCDSSALFHRLNIAKSTDYVKHLNQYDVIHIDINSFRNQKSNVESIVSDVQIAVIEELREVYSGYLSNEIRQLSVALSMINKICGNKFIIIVDEWDAIFRENKYDIEAQNKYISFLRGLFKDVPSEKFLKMAYLTGILPIKKYGTESALNNFDEFTMLEPDELAEYVGFTEEEVSELYRINNMDFEKAKQWYDGYKLQEEVHVYNPKSVVDSIRRKRIGNYWINTETYESLKSYISMNFDGLKDVISQMITGASCKVNPAKFQNDMTSFRSKDDILTLLVHLGYLAYDSHSQRAYIPNEEVKSGFVNAIEDAFNWCEL